ncbi:hypothetical protein EJ03DRAFT_342409 [Teratosphaeria nubilosa]|uniref:C2H2-type domain-containing protein n=1 Tax=Teratosphaeria nubilosa TaxID=161662 RepID=A0A6G1LDV0_9PEZI|nr:hypothetical protein EJ03DRAFT_342409 [Teratosphaeria nubilosa]
MTTFAEYQAQTMASSNDFTLYPYQEQWHDQSFLPTNGFQDQSYIDTTTFDSFPPQQTYVQPNQDEFIFGAPALQQPKSNLPPPSPHYSPANSASHSFDYYSAPKFSSLSDSGASIQSTISSAMGSPAPHPQQVNEWNQQQMSMVPGIVHHDSLAQDMFTTTGYDLETMTVTDKGCVDPSLIQPYSPPHFTGAQFPDLPAVQSPQHAPKPSPAPDAKTAIQSPRQSNGKAPSPYTNAYGWEFYPSSRRQSVSSVHSRQSQVSHSSDDSNKGLCPIPTCGRHVKDLKTHMLTHQNERPEKCPIPTCEYHIKGFARKYDKNRHTLTHYKGTMVCGFCPGSGSAAEKSFNRADVFKRHLTSVHGVEQTPPNARRKSPAVTHNKRIFGSRDVSGMCSTCGLTFASAQDFYEHLDDCVLRVVQQADPSEAINEKLLGAIAEDEQVQETMERHMLPTTGGYNGPTSFDDEEEPEDDEEGEEEDAKDGTYGSRSSRSGKGTIKARKAGGSTLQSANSRVGAGNHVSSTGAVTKLGQKKGLTYSKNGVPLAGAMSGKGSKRRKNYPLSWGAAPEKMKMRKRVLCVFDGPRRLWKDDMMLDADHEVRIPLQNSGDGRGAWVTDLDVQTVSRAEGILNATDEEKGPWVEEDDGELERLLA